MLIQQLGAEKAWHCYNFMFKCNGTAAFLFEVKDITLKSVIYVDRLVSQIVFKTYSLKSTCFH